MKLGTHLLGFENDDDDDDNNNNNNNNMLYYCIIIHRGHLFLNCSLTEAFCIAILEAARFFLLFFSLQSPPFLKKKERERITMSIISIYLSISIYLYMFFFFSLQLWLENSQYECRRHFGDFTFGYDHLGRTKYVCMIMMIIIIICILYDYYYMYYIV